MTHPIIFHVGYHKTATSWMQTLLFTPEHSYRQIADHKEVFQHIVQPHGLRFDPAGMQQLIAQRRAGLQPNEVPVVSSEILSGHPFQGGHENDVYAERLARIAPDARILISTRTQLKMLPSVYMQYVLRGGTMPMAHFFEGTQEVGYFGFTPEHFEYDLLVAKYQQLFGAENVYVLPQEDLIRDMKAATQAFADFAGNTAFTGLSQQAQVVRGASYPEYSASVLRRINHIQASTLNPTPIVRLGTTPYGLYKLAGFALKHPPFSSLMSGRKPVSDYVRKRFTGRFTQSNARLRDLVHHPADFSAYT